MTISTYTEEITTILTRFETVINGWPPVLNVSWQNSRLEPKRLSEYVRVDVIPINAARVGLGSDEDLNRYEGELQVQIFTTPNNGSYRALEIADVLSNAFRDLRLDDITFRTPYISIGGQVAGWYQVNMSCRYQRDSFLVRT